MDIIEDIDDPAIPIARACEALGVSRASVYRCTTPSRPPSHATRAPSPRRLGEDERNAILGVLHSERFADQPPPEVYAALLSQGVYMASIRTMYRLLTEQGENAERRAQRAPARHVKPTLSATAPNQVWTWDITKLRSVVPGVMFCLYVIIDLFSRMVVGWLLAERENGAHAERLFAEAIARHDVAPGALTVHADRGAPMKSVDLAQLFALLGVARSFSRPHVSDDNAFSEAQFKTLKYQPDYPGAFASMAHARAWCQEFFGWFNEHHQHSGIALFTPAEVFYGRVEEVAARRQAALDGAHAANPERFPNGRPVARRPPAAVHINPSPIDEDAAERVAASAEEGSAARAAAKTPRREPRVPDARNQSAPHAAAKTPRREARAAAVVAAPS
ncbi:IS3 family transposase [Polyangium spumosum]|uniref:IS3 family transposase n=1 Tax=Polyangium spumosum TaxID=889282 RepID=A0A6N7Q7G5_9BACT|nr:IS3 family transposase [Polyangium spumosum]MRG98665.1 IS3 family transposase [Polyangium spumosum]